MSEWGMTPAQMSEIASGVLIPRFDSTFPQGGSSEKVSLITETAVFTIHLFSKF